MEPVLRMEKITKEFLGVRVLHGVNFDVFPVKSWRSSEKTAPENPL